LPQRFDSDALRRASRGFLPFLLALALAGCGDDPTCVFTSGCQGGGSGSLGDPASLPVDGQSILPDAPEIEALFPDGAASSTTPVLVIFSESMAPDTNEGKLELVRLDISGFPGGTVPTAQALVASGRVLALLPAEDLPAGDYIVRLAPGQKLLDLTGQKASVGAEATLVSFQVDTEDPETPLVVGTFPQASGGAAGDPETKTPIVVAFDRPIDPVSIPSGFQVEVDGQPPLFDPDPVPLLVPSVFVPISDTRVLIYQSADDGVPQSLGTGAAVVLTLSPAGSELLDEAGNALEEFTLEFNTQDVEAPLGAEIVSAPAEGIGIANLTPGAPEELALEVELEGGEPGDELLITLFGMSKVEEQGDESQLFALSRTVELAGSAPIQLAELELADFDVISDPGVARFADGELAIAFALRRGLATTPLRLLDVDADSPGIQDPLLDTVAPELQSLSGASAAVLELRSDQRGLSVSGIASEVLREVRVVTPLGDNLADPGVIGSNADGLFLASPVDLGLLADGGPVAFDMTLFDRVLNGSATSSATFTQHGALSGANLVPGASIAVEVLDARTLAPIVGARVVTHADQGDGVNFPLVDSAVTGSDGKASVLSAALPAVGTLCSVDAATYGLWTFHGVEAARLSVVLEPTASSASTVLGSVTTTNDFAEGVLDAWPKKLDDARRAAGTTPDFDGEDCASDPFGGLALACPFGPEPVEPGRLGALSLLAGNFGLTEATFSASTLIQAFDLLVPRPALAAGSNDTAEIAVPFSLLEPGLDPSETPLEVLGPLGEQVTFFGTLAAGLDLGSLADDPLTTGTPWVSVEAVTPGVPGSVSVGLGLAFEVAPGAAVWNLRAGYAGAVSPTGFFGLAGVDSDVFLRVELRDTHGNRSGQRPRQSRLADLPVPFSVFAPALPLVSAPPAASTVTSEGFAVDFANALPDAAGEPGLYAVRLRDAGGRSWVIYRQDPPDGVPAGVFAPDLTLAGGSALANGPVTLEVLAWAWPDLDTASLLWSDIAREHDLFAATAAITFNYAPAP
jgi:hypothetical protein